MIWAVPFFFAVDDSIEDVFDITYVQIDSAREKLIKQQPAYRKVQYANWNEKAALNKNPQTNRFMPKQFVMLDINKADSIELERLPTIGEKLSSRIIRYRERLGGFIELSQLKEVYGLTDSAYQIIFPLLKIEKGFKPKLIDINKAEYTDLRKHPYATNVFVKIVLAYRKAHGHFADRTALEKVDQIDRALLDKIEPYLLYTN
ncbi:MAG: hypothetical protein RL000_1150 [Bacteroidota bacterium]